MLHRDAKQIARAGGTGLQGLNGVGQIIDRARQRSEMKHPVNVLLKIKRHAHIMFDKFKVWVTEKMLDILLVPGN